MMTNTQRISSYSNGTPRGSNGAHNGRRQQWGQFTTHHTVYSHVTGKDLWVVYTNNTVSMEISIQSMEQLLAKDKYQVVVFDLEYTNGHAGQDQKNSLVDLASAIIDPYYMKMKDETKKDKNALHSASDQRLDEECCKYEAKDAYTSYEMYKRLFDMRKCLCPSQDEGSNRGAMAGASQEVDD
ncbi:putative methyltransferase PMT27 [Hordeum vulgare]|nr:putative methyltransferase PMT27 [Hordeum vulgare]